MEIGGFVCDWPLWIVTIEDGANEGWACCEVEGRICLSLYTDQDLAERSIGPIIRQVKGTPARIDSPTQLLLLLVECLENGDVRHIAIDPGVKAFVYPITEILEHLEITNSR